MLHIRKRDLRRATLPVGSGNEGWIGCSPSGDQYHVVVPVDAQIARGVMACNRPDDGTPFGGYAGWLYFRCQPYDDEHGTDEASREKQVRENSEGLIRWLASYGVACDLEEDQANDERTRSETAPGNEGAVAE